MNARRVALVGIDGFSPVWMDRFLREGKLPALKALARDGVSASLVSTLPATTPVAWTTIATGCSPAITGIEGFLLHRPGDPLDQRVSGCYAHRCLAEPIWETASRVGKHSYVVKFPLSYPSSTATFRLDGAAGWGGLKCLHEAASSSVASMEASNGNGELVPSHQAWASNTGREGQELWYGCWSLRMLWGRPPLVLHLALTRSSEQGIVVSIADTPDWRCVLTSLQEGEWSAPLTVRAKGRGGEADHCFRIKALSCSASPFSLRLLNTTIHERLGHSAPAATWEKYVGLVGPIEEQTEPSLLFSADLNLMTQLEIFHLNAEWLKRTSVSILGNEEWDLFMVQAHFVDWAHHILHGAIDPRHPDFDPATAPDYEQALVESYRMADELVAAVREAIGPDADLIVLGDHGQDLHHTTFRTNEWLASEGFLEWMGDGNEVDWSRTRVYATGNYLYLNLEGREPTGIVPAAEVERTKEQVIDRLLDVTDPLTNFRPVLIASRKQEFEPLGANGIGVGDIVFCLHSGYQARNGRGNLFTKTKLLREFTSGHDHFWPLDPRLHTRLFAVGASFRQGYIHPYTEHIMDVAPTVCRALGIAPSAQYQGHAIHALFRRSRVLAQALTCAK